MNFGTAEWGVERLAWINSYLTIYNFDTSTKPHFWPSINAYFWWKMQISFFVQPKSLISAEKMINLIWPTPWSYIRISLLVQQESNVRLDASQSYVRLSCVRRFFSCLLNNTMDHMGVLCHVKLKRFCLPIESIYTYR